MHLEKFSPSTLIDIKRTICMRISFPFCRSFFLFVLILVQAGCLSLAPGSKDLYYKSFYDKTRLIMTEEEKRIYGSLPDDASKRDFIEEFWEMRDPDPTTDENENKIAFEDRIAFANEWFGNWRAFPT